MFQKALFSSTCTLAFLLSSCERSQENVRNEEFSHVINVALEDDVNTIDPRLARDLVSGNAVHMLFEGLMQHDSKGQLIPGVAEKVELSTDKKTYTFTLRKSHWSNGDPVTSQDFAYSWRKLFSPDFPAPNAYQFYSIKGAKDAKEGKIPLDQIGIKTPDSSTLVVELDSPLSYFLELTAFHASYPVNSIWEKNNPDWSKVSPHDIPVNGAFKIEKWSRNHVFIVQKNPYYYNANKVKIDKVVGMILEPTTAFQMFSRNALNWTGSPLCVLPPDAIPSLKEKGYLRIAPAAGTQWFRVNIEKPPFTNEKMRRAFAYALNRKEICDHILQGGQSPALGIIPPSMKLDNRDFFTDNDVAEAKKLFEEALQETGLTKENFPVVKLSFSSNERSNKVSQAVQQQWEKAFGIKITLDGGESKSFYEKVSTKEFQLAYGSWFADIQDPINFLDVFKYRSNKTNNTQWEDQKYISLLNQSSVETDRNKRRLFLMQAEKILMDAMPVIPLFFCTFNYVKDEDLRGVYVSDLGYIDFKTGYFDADAAPEVNGQLSKN
jgi:oligopeptide transport system substrate-binding protein